MADFLLTVEQLRARRNVKWTAHPPDVLPAWLAEMDFTVAPAIHAAVTRLAAQQDYGYRFFGEAPGFGAAFARRMQSRYGWEADPAQVLPVADVVQGMYATTFALSDPGAGVLVLTPIFPPFLQAIRETGRRVVACPLADDGTRFVLDPVTLRAAIDDTTRILLICSPHNPTGRVWSREELTAITDVALERDLIIVSDEIYADMVYPGGEHTPIAALGPEIAARTVTLTSATKAFNIAGLRCGAMHFGTAALEERFLRALTLNLLGPVNSVGLDATIAAWDEGQPWLDAVMRQLQANRDRLAQRLREELPDIRHYPPESTYLAWLDCRALDLPVPPAQFFLEEARVALRGGADFGPQGEGASCLRLTFATAPDILDTILDRMSAAVGRLKR